MSTRLDLTLQRYSGHEDGIRLLASRDQSGNLKYLDWAARVVAAGQALAPEVADVIELFHRFRGQRPEGAPNGRYRVGWVNPDIYTYRPEDFAKLRDLLNKIKRSRDRKQKKRERLYRIEGAVEADVVYDSPDLVVRHIKNKQASAHYGLGTKWCISMLRDGYFDDYEVQNATFFFFERKVKAGDDFDKVALTVPRGSDHGEDQFSAFTSLDRRVDAMSLAKVYGPRIFDIFRLVYEHSERYPGSTLSRVYAGVATREQIESAYALIVKGDVGASDIGQLLEAICCNDEAPWPLLETISRIATVLLSNAVRRSRRRRHCRMRPGSDRELVRAIEAALAIHPNVPTGDREKLVKQLRRRHVSIGNIRRVTHHNDRVGIAFEAPVLRGSAGTRYRRRRWRLRDTPKALRAYAESLVRRAKRMRDRAKKLERRSREKAKKKLVAAKKARRP